MSIAILLVTAHQLMVKRALIWRARVEIAGAACPLLELEELGTTEANHLSISRVERWLRR